MANLENKVEQDKAPKRQWIPLYGAVDASIAFVREKPSIIEENFFGSMIYHGVTGAMILYPLTLILEKFQ